MILYHKIPAISSVFLNLKQKRRECFYLELCKFYPCILAREEGKGAKQGVHKEAVPQGQYTFHFA